MRRLFWVGVGAVAAVVVVERVRRAARQYTPAAVTEQLGALGHRTTSALHDARVRFDTARAAREQELMTALLVTPTGGDPHAVFGGGRSAAPPSAASRSALPARTAGQAAGATAALPAVAEARPAGSAPAARVDADEPLYDF